MQALKVQVKNGRLVVDEPTDLPDGAEVEVVVIDDKLTPEERVELHASLDRALDDSEAGAFAFDGLASRRFWVSARKDELYAGPGSPESPGPGS